MARKPSGGKCTCSPGWMVLAAIVIGIGALVGIQGFVIQLTLGGAWDDMNSLAWVLGYYIVGVLLVGAGKALKCKPYCSVHMK